MCPPSRAALSACDGGLSVAGDDRTLELPAVFRRGRGTPARAAPTAEPAAAKVLAADGRDDLTRQQLNELRQAGEFQALVAFHAERLTPQTCGAVAAARWPILEAPALAPLRSIAVCFDGLTTVGKLLEYCCTTPEPSPDALHSLQAVGIRLGPGSKFCRTVIVELYSEPVRRAFDPHLRPTRVLEILQHAAAVDAGGPPLVRPSLDCLASFCIPRAEPTG